MKKICTRCGKKKPLDKFPSHKHRSWCKLCRVEYYREWKERNKEHVTARRKERWEKDKPHIQAVSAEYYRRNAANLNARSLARSKLKVKTLTRGYCISQLQSRGFAREQITPELIAAYRALVKLKRAVWEIEK